MRAKGMVLARAGWGQVTTVSVARTVEEWGLEGVRKFATKQIYSAHGKVSSKPRDTDNGGTALATTVLSWAGLSDITIAWNK